MPNSEPCRIANGGVPRRLTLDLMREMQRLIEHDFLPDEIWSSACQRLAFKELLADREFRVTVGGPITSEGVHALVYDGAPIITNTHVPDDQMQWRRAGRVVGVLADLVVPR